MTLTGRTERHFRNRQAECRACSHRFVFQSLPFSCPRCQSKDCGWLDQPDEWWNQAALESARVLVIGCGAVGNESIKNLVLMGVASRGHVTLVDFDHVEESNRNRCIFFNEVTLGGKSSDRVPKVDAVAEGIRSVTPSTRVVPISRGLWTRKAFRSGAPWIKDSIHEQELAELGRSHDVCLVCVDGEDPITPINRFLYPELPLVRGGMDSFYGQTLTCMATVPKVSACLRCFFVGTSHVVFDPAHKLYSWEQVHLLTGEHCAVLAERLGARAFAHTTSAVGALMASQALLLLMGYPALKSSIGSTLAWPQSLPAPLWGERVTVSTMLSFAGALRVAAQLDATPDGSPVCEHCLEWWESGTLTEDSSTTRNWPRFVNPGWHPRPRGDRRRFVAGAS